MQPSRLAIAMQVKLHRQICQIHNDGAENLLTWHDQLLLLHSCMNQDVPQQAGNQVFLGLQLSVWWTFLLASD